jgi:coniferyl-aldehyde dehydrogenase
MATPRTRYFQAIPLSSQIHIDTHETRTIFRVQATREALVTLLETHRRAFRQSVPGYRQRNQALQKLEQALLRRKNDFIRAIADDFGGRSAEETVALELFPVVNEIRHARRHLRRWMAPRHAPVPWQFWPARARVQYQPLGVAGILSAWNYPVFLTLGPLVGAVAAGNHVMLKPSELAPRSAELIGSLIAELYPPDYITVVLGDSGVAAEFSVLPFDHLLFTGSGRVGKLVMRAASENLTPVTLELGGKSPALIHPTYPLRRATERILNGKLYNAGQTCVAPDYVLLPTGRKDEFVRLAQSEIAALYPRLVDNPDYTRVLNLQHYGRLAGLVQEARETGAEVVEINPAGESCDERNRVFPPTLIFGASETITAMREEVFGPVLPVVLYDRLDQAIEYINARPHPLAFYYFDENGKRIRDVLARTMSGGVTVNGCVYHLGQPDLPFGGVGPSGMGQYHGFDGFETFSKKKGIFLQSRWTPLKYLQPPYGEKTRRILRFILGA